MTIGTPTARPYNHQLPTYDTYDAPIVDLFAGPGGWDRTRQYQQIGNAVPPRLAAHVIAEAIGLERSAVLERIARYYEESRQEIAARRSA